MINDEYITQLIIDLKKCGIRFADGLASSRINEIESKLEGAIPSGLRLLLNHALPVSSSSGNGYFPDWRDDLDKVISEYYSLVDDYLLSDIDSGGFWHKILGEKPDDIEEAKEQALQVIHSWPKLMPVFAHRFVVVGVEESPVFSYHGPLDTIYYGYDLPGYLHQEFGVSKPDWAKKEPVPIDKWDELFFG